MSTNSKLIEPFGVGRSHRHTPCSALYVASVAMIDDSLSQRINSTLTAPTPSATPITNSMPRLSENHPSSGPSTNDDTTRHSEISAPTDTSNALTISALVCAIAASASGIVATMTPLRLNVREEARVPVVRVAAEHHDEQHHRRDRQPAAELEL